VYVIKLLQEKVIFSIFQVLKDVQGRMLIVMGNFLDLLFAFLLLSSPFFSFLLFFHLSAVHQTITFRKLDENAMIELSGRPSTQDSWFPGYAWTILYCQRCFNHLGW
jgi:hypothetical protein